MNTSRIYAFTPDPILILEGQTIALTFGAIQKKFLEKSAPIPGIAVALSITAPGITVSPASGSTGTNGVFPCSITRSGAEAGTVADLTVSINVGLASQQDKIVKAIMN
ncbi:MAG: hypothetical protein H7Y00_08340, partial [Fimbriimonadaceae bacterium]|nr:hypothetical protein [Chitinophagales bacterium]